MSKLSTYKKQIGIIVSIILLVMYWFALPTTLFKKPTSTVVYSKNGILLSAHIASDEQWRFPQSDSIPPKFKRAIINFEDQYYYYHPGVNLFSLFRAAYQDIKAGKIVSGGSTISMQTIRMAYDNPPRNILQKIKEIIIATRLEISNSKEEILRLYASNAPFGSNVVGLDAAAWRFFGRSAFNLSWAETATLAVLPNAPALIYPGRNQQKLLSKRNRLLLKMMHNNEFDSLTYSLSILEPLPQKMIPLPNYAPHLLQQFRKNKKGELINSTIDYYLQKKALSTLQQYAKGLKANNIFNAAILIIEVETGNVLSYVGNTKSTDSLQNHGHYVDLIHAKRSSGSILKPLLYAYMLQEGKMLQKSLLTDIPTNIGGYRPQNFDKSYHGVVPADEALQQSLNIPAVRMLRQYGYHRFHHRLKELGFSTINRSADNYGLSLILGGAEVTLWDLATIYSSMARVLNNFYIKDYDKSDWHSPYSIAQAQDKSINGKKLDATSIWLTFETLQKLNRPQDESGWSLFSSTRKIAWKTGTSHGFRDAWAIGVDSKYAVAVWVGNADGEGRPGVTGIGAAAPLMFQLFEHLPTNSWFEMPEPEMISAKVCAKSGFRASENCPIIIDQLIHKNGIESPLCTFHKLIHLDINGQNQVNSNCESVGKMQHKKMFVLSAAQAWYYKQRHPQYTSPPPFRFDCQDSRTNSIEVIYPKSGAKVFIPINHSENKEAVVFEAAHKQANIKIYWHLDAKYIGFTEDFHQKEISPQAGKHKLRLVDENGESVEISFTVMGE